MVAGHWNEPVFSCSFSIPLLYNSFTIIRQCSPGRLLDEFNRRHSPQNHGPEINYCTGWLQESMQSNLDVMFQLIINIKGMCTVCHYTVEWATLKYISFFRFNITSHLTHIQIPLFHHSGCQTDVQFHIAGLDWLHKDKRTIKCAECEMMSWVEGFERNGCGYFLDS